MTKEVQEYLNGLKKITMQGSYDVDEQYGRVLIMSSFNKSKSVYKVPLGELFLDFDKYKNTYGLTINDFYIIAKGYGYIFNEIKKEIFLTLSIKEKD